MESQANPEVAHCQSVIRNPRSQHIRYRIELSLAERMIRGFGQKCIESKCGHSARATFGRTILIQQVLGILRRLLGVIEGKPNLPIRSCDLLTHGLDQVFVHFFGER